MIFIDMLIYVVMLFLVGIMPRYIQKLSLTNIYKQIFSTILVIVIAFMFLLMSKNSYIMESFRVFSVLYLVFSIYQISRASS